MFIVNITKKQITITAIVLILCMIIAFLNIPLRIQKIIYKKDYKEYVQKYAQEYNVDENLIYALIKAESNFNSNAKSSKDAIGLMQLMESTAQDVCKKTDLQISSDELSEKLLEPDININIGTKYLSILIQKYGNIEIAITAYNAGIGTVDNWIETPVRDTDKPFLMPIEDVFTITGRGTVVTGRVERGMLKLNDEVEIVGLKPTKKTVVTGIEMFRKQLDFAEAGDNAGVLLRGISREDVERGQVLAKPGSVHPHKKFKAQVYVLSKEEGGRHTPFFTNYRPQFYFRTTDVTGVITLPEGTEMVMPGDNVTMTVELIAPIAVENGTKFSIREGGRTVGAGSVSEIIE